MQRDNLPKHYSREHYNHNGKAKRVYQTEGEANREIKHRKLKNYKPYVCKVCNCYHIGRQKQEL